MGILLNSHIEISLRLLELVEVVVRQSSVLVMGARRLDADSFTVVHQGLFKFLVFEIAETQVVVGRWLVVSHFNSFFKIFNGFLKLSDST